MLRAPRWSLALVAVATLSVAGAGIAVLVVATNGGNSSRTPGVTHTSAAALTAYTAALRRPTAQGGQVVEQEMKPSIADISSGQISGATLVNRARSWQIAFARVRAAIDAITVPKGLEDAQRLFDSAIDGYAQTAALLLQAGTAGVDQRSALLDDAVGAGRDADATYDRAAALVQAALRAAGLGPDLALPNPTPTPS